MGLVIIQEDSVGMVVACGGVVGSDGGASLLCQCWRNEDWIIEKRI